MTNFFSVAVIGVAHGHAYQMCAGLELEGAKIDYVCENSERERNHFLSIYPQAKSATEADILQNADVDLVVIAGIPAERAEAAVRAMRVGKDVLSAKAPAISLEQLNLLRRTVEETGRRYFVFYSERLDLMWIMSSEEFLKECVTNKTGKNTGKRSIWFNGNKTNKQTGVKEEYCYQKFEKYIAKDFSRFH